MEINMKNRLCWSILVGCVSLIIGLAAVLYCMSCMRHRAIAVGDGNKPINARQINLTSTPNQINKALTADQRGELSTNSQRRNDGVSLSNNTADDSTNTNGELFKVVIDTNTGFYLSTDFERQNVYGKWRNGKVFSINSISEFLHIPSVINGDVQKINSMKIVDGHLEISVGDSNYVLISKESTGRN